MTVILPRYPQKCVAQNEYMDSEKLDKSKNMISQDRVQKFVPRTFLKQGKKGKSRTITVYLHLPSV